MMEQLKIATLAGAVCTAILLAAPAKADETVPTTPEQAKAAEQVAKDKRVLKKKLEADAPSSELDRAKKKLQKDRVNKNALDGKEAAEARDVDVE